MTLHAEDTQGIGFLLADVSRLLRRNFNRMAQSLGLTQTQWLAIAHLARNQGIRQNQLAEILEVQPISVARLIDRMETAGWVKRSPDPTDRRAFNLYLTDKSEPILKEMRSYATKVRTEALAGLTEKDQQALLKNLSIMRQNLCDKAQ